MQIKTPPARSTRTFTLSPKRASAWRSVSLSITTRILPPKWQLFLRGRLSCGQDSTTSARPPTSCSTSGGRIRGPIQPQVTDADKKMYYGDAILYWTRLNWKALSAKQKAKNEAEAAAAVSNANP